MFWVYGKQDCSYCRRAVELLQGHNQRVAYIDIANIPNTANWKTVPQVFTETDHIGGYEDLVNYLTEFKNERTQRMEHGSNN